ncbi:MAG TPA: hypothetical protein VER11_03115 [Polyangiaceae bacterium]|nr:hypothetical protein [Polyangiaceae bacterium]
MLRLRLLLVSAVCSAACAQIAGFDHLNSRNLDSADGGSGAASAGKSATSGGNEGVAGRESSSGDSGASAGGHAGSGGNASPGSAGNVIHGSAGSAPVAGAAGSGGKAPIAGSGGSAPSAGSAGSAATAGAAGAPVIGGCNAELLKNGDFDAGPVDWRQESTAPGILEVSDLIVNGAKPALIAANVAPRSGNYLAWLGGVLDTDKGSRTNLLQDVQIPAKVSKLTVTGWLQITTTETNPNDTTDQLDLTLQDDKDYWSFHFWKGTEVTNGWKSFSYSISEGNRLDALRGRTLTFYAEAIGDTSQISSFWLDSISLYAECPH